MRAKVYRNSEPTVEIKTPTASSNKDEILAWLKTEGRIDASAETGDFTKPKLVEMLEA